MDNRPLQTAFKVLSTPQIVDACLRERIPFHVAPPGIKAAIPTKAIAGRVIPVQHFGSADVFLEAMELAEKGDVLVVDNGGRMDEACIGDLIAIEASKSRLAGIILWGVHRDTDLITRESFPVFSYGCYPIGPIRLDARSHDALKVAKFGEFSVSRKNVVFADCDGVVFGYLAEAEKIVKTANYISRLEQQQTQLIAKGTSLREQFRFKEYIKKRGQDPAYTFGKHLQWLDDVAIGEQGS